ncbi:MAG TPA: hypothetical protein VES79_09235 [Solirubrobacteraceae bacterium]|nr:hypothetical protein [Solirubrobacteraceae bacterium]
MEAATHLRPPRVHVLANAVVIDGLTITDPAAVQLVRARAAAGEDPAKVVADAVEIGARVLDREQAGATVELFRADLEKSTREAETTLIARTTEVAEAFGRKFDEAFGAETGHLSRALERHFGDGSSQAVQHQIRQVMTDIGVKTREDIVRQFSSADAANPLAGFQKMAIATMRHGAEQQSEHLRLLNEQLTGLKLEVQKLQSQKEKQAEVAAEHDRSTAKGRPYEEGVFDAVDAVATARGDDCDAVGDVRGAGGRKGDVLVGVDGCAGPARGRIVFEAKNSHKSKKAALEELDEAMVQRDAAYGVWVVPSEELLPARTHQLREVNGDKLFVVYDPEDGSRLALEVAYSLARARVVMARAGEGGLDAAAVRAEVERALGAMEDVRRIKVQLTTASGGIDEARRILGDMAERVRGHLQHIDGLVAAVEPSADD